MSDVAMEGGCLCGDVRYRLSEVRNDVPLCHCINCRKASGAPLVAWVNVPRAAFAWTGTEPSSYEYASETAPRVRRHFCSRCGSQLVWERVGGSDMDVAVGTLDDAEAVRPTRHTYAHRQLSWMQLRDDRLPRS